MNCTDDLRVFMARPIPPFGVTVLVAACYQVNDGHIQIETFFFTTQGDKFTAHRKSKWEKDAEKAIGASLIEFLYEDEKAFTEQKLTDMIQDKTPEPWKQIHLREAELLKKVENKELVKLWLANKLDDKLVKFLYTTSSSSFRSFLDSFCNLPRPKFTREES